MPRTMIYPVPNPDGTDADRRIEVGWSRNGDVQVATTKLYPGADRHREFVDLSARPVTGGEQESLTGYPTESTIRTWDGQFVDLNREQINDLIRNLRRARDQAFGRDE